MGSNHQAETTQNVERSRGGTIGTQGRRRALQLAAEAEIERQNEETALLRDLGRPPSHAERVIVEQLSMLVVRGRRLRQCGKGADAEMIARLVLRGLTRLGVRQGPAKPRLSFAEKLEAKIAAERAAEGHAQAEADRATDVAAGQNECTGAASAQGGGI